MYLPKQFAPQPVQGWKLSIKIYLKPAQGNKPKERGMEIIKGIFGSRFAR